jgi:PleD family two-component response regulator
VTCSFGVAQLTDDMEGPAELYDAADRALMTSKRRGRNRVHVNSPQIAAQG